MTGDDASWVQVAEALETEVSEARQRCGWGESDKSPEGELAAWVQNQLRPLRWLRASHLVPPYLRERAIQDAVTIIESLAGTRRTCPWGSRTGVEVFAIPLVPPCARSSAEREIEAANQLAAWGYPAAADRLAEHATSWSQVRCPKRTPRATTRSDALQAGEPTEAEPARCACAAVEVKPALVRYGRPPPSGRLIWALGLVDMGRDDISGRRPKHSCPWDCVPVSWLRVGSPSLGRVHDGPLDWVELDDLTIVADDLSGVETALARTAHALRACGSGVAEWLGRWTPWEGGAGACLAEVLSGTVPASSWMAVEVRSL